MTAEPVEKIDDIDVTMLRLMQQHGRVKRNRMADEVGLSIPSVSDRMRKLEERGVVTGYHAVLDAKRIGYDVTAFVRVQQSGSEHYPDFVEAATAMPEVQEVHSITGEGSHLLKIRTRNTTTLEGLLARIQQLPGVRGTQTSIVLSTAKETRYLEPEPMPLVPANGLAPDA